MTDPVAAEEAAFTSPRRKDFLPRAAASLTAQDWQAVAAAVPAAVSASLQQ